MKPVKLLQHQREFVESTAEECLLSGAYGGGKAQPLNSKILTPFGWKTMGEISVGDYIISGRDGKWAKVLQIHPQGIIDIYKVSFSDGTHTECSNEHLWEVCSKAVNKLFVVQTEDLRKYPKFQDGPRWFIPGRDLDCGFWSANIPDKYIISVEYIGKKEAQCITVEKELYVTDDYIVTHNSLALCTKVAFLLTRYAKNRGFLGRKTLQSLKSSTLKTLLDGDGEIPPALPDFLIKRHNRQDRLITLTNGSELFYGNVDPEFLKSMNLGFAAIDEVSELTEEEYNAVNGRLRLPHVPTRQIFGATNPASPQHWLYNRFVLNPRVENGKPMTFFRTSKTTDNIFLPKSYINNLEKTLFGFYHKRYVLGEWVGADDIVFDNFDPRVHIIKSFPIPRHWKLYRSIDFGYRSPFVCVWFAIAHENLEEYNIKKNDVVLYRELYYTQRTTAVNAERVVHFSKYPDGIPEKYQYTFADWDCGDRADLESKGIKTVKANKDISVGIQKVRARLGNNDPTRGALIEPTFFIFEDSLCEIDPKIKVDIETGKQTNNPAKAAEEFMTYGWKKYNDPTKLKDIPEDIHNHAMDAIRYFFCTFEGGKMWREIPFTTI